MSVPSRRADRRNVYRDNRRLDGIIVLAFWIAALLIVAGLLATEPPTQSTQSTQSTQPTYPTYNE